MRLTLAVSNATNACHPVPRTLLLARQRRQPPEAIAGCSTRSVLFESCHIKMSMDPLSAAGLALGVVDLCLRYDVPRERKESNDIAQDMAGR